MKRSERIEIIKTLELFRFLRERLANSFLNEDPDLYINMLPPHQGAPVISMAIERYYLKWLFSHVDFFSEMIAPLRGGESYRNSENIFFSFYKILCELFIVKTDSHSSLKSDSLMSLVERNISYLDNILLVSGEHEKKIKKIKYMQHKSQYQFDNLLKNLLGNESEHA